MGRKDAAWKRNNYDSISDIFKLAGSPKQEKQLPLLTQEHVREISSAEADSYLELEHFNAFRIALGIMFCIDSPVVAILIDGFDMAGLIPSGAAELFEGMSMIIFVAIAVCMYIYSAIRMSRWDYMKEERCHIDENTIRFIKIERLIFKKTHNKMMIFGLGFILLSALPHYIFTRISSDFIFMDNLSMALFLMLASIGIFLIVMTCLRLYTFYYLLGINKRKLHPSHENHSEETDRKYSNQLIAKGMSVYWPTIACFYISMSFLTFAWGISWIIWPMAWIVNEIIGKIFSNNN